MLYEVITVLLRDAGIESIIIDGVEPNPSVETVYRGAKEMLAFNPDWIVAIGGGSALDAAKVMWCFYEHPQLKFEDIIEVGSMPSLRNKARFVAIPSTSGTASEITAFSVITDTENHIKYPIVAADMVPDLAILDPSLPECMPPHITANTGMDVMCHAVEAVASKAATSFTDPYAIEAIRLVLENLEQAYTTPHDKTARTHMHNASALAGIVITSYSIHYTKLYEIGRLFAGSDSISCSNNLILPELACSNPPSNRSNVVFPQPEGPSSVKNSPS